MEMTPPPPPAELATPLKMDLSGSYQRQLEKNFGRGAFTFTAKQAGFKLRLVENGLNVWPGNGRLDNSIACSINLIFQFKDIITVSVITQDKHLHKHARRPINLHKTPRLANLYNSI